MLLKYLEVTVMDVIVLQILNAYSRLALTICVFLLVTPFQILMNHLQMDVNALSTVNAPPLIASLDPVNQHVLLTMKSSFTLTVVIAHKILNVLQHCAYPMLVNQFVT